MSFLRKEEKVSVSTPIPHGLSREAMLASLHDHERIIKLSPEVEGYALVTGNLHMSAKYSVTDRKPIGKTTYELSITNQNDGVDTEVTAHPPIGVLKIWSKFRILGQGTEMVLKEDVRIEASRLMVSTVKGNIEKTHPGQHQQIIEAAKSQAMP